MEVFEATIEDDVIIYSDPTRDVYCYIFERDDFDKFKQVMRGEEQGVYILHSRLTGEIYIGEGKFKNRIVSHLENKDFWDIALVFNSTIPEKFHKSYLEYFEASFIKKALLNDIPMTNGQGGKRGLCDSKSKAYFRVMEEMIRVSVMGNIFKNKRHIEKVAKSNKVEELNTAIDNCYYYESNDKKIKGTLKIKDNEYILLKGSICKTEAKPYLEKSYIRTKKLYTQDITEDYFILKEDLSFSSISASAIFLTGRSVNGYDFWKDSKGEKIKRENF